MQGQDKSNSVEQAVKIVNGPVSDSGLVNQPPATLQTYNRLMQLQSGGMGVLYKFQESDAPAWKTLMNNEQTNMYARLCAAYFLLDRDSDARHFIEDELKSDNLRYRYNTANVVVMYVGNDPNKTWGIDLLIEKLGNGAFDGNGIMSSSEGDYPDGDRDDIMMKPLDEICWQLGSMKVKRAVPALISILERQPHISGAIFALGEIGDQQAVPILMRILIEGSIYDGREITALGQLKCKEAVPILISRLGHSKKLFSEQEIETEIILDALLEIGDPQAIPAIEKFLEGDYSKESKAVAKRVLAQFKSRDVVERLLELLKTETDEWEKGKIISASVQYKDERVVNELKEIARNSESAFMRRQAIFGLEQIGTRHSLLELSALLEVEFPEHLKNDWNWKEPPKDFSKFFPKLLVERLKAVTKQDFRNDSKKWREWIEKEYK